MLFPQAAGRRRHAGVQGTGEEAADFRQREHGGLFGRQKAFRRQAGNLLRRRQGGAGIIRELHKGMQSHAAFRGRKAGMTEKGGTGGGYKLPPHAFMRQLRGRQLGGHLPQRRIGIGISQPAAQGLVYGHIRLHGGDFFHGVFSRGRGAANLHRPRIGRRTDGDGVVPGHIPQNFTGRVAQGAGQQPFAHTTSRQNRKGR